MIFIFTEALRTTGLGHLGRCTALAEAFLEAGKKVEVYLHSDGTGMNVKYPFPLHRLDWKNKTELLKILDTRRPQTTFVDSYLASADVYTHLGTNATNLVCIDDTNRVTYPAGAIILNPGFPGLYINYDRSRHSILTGPEYVLLRKPFRDPVQLPDLKHEPDRIVITVGGEDRLNLMPYLLRCLCQEYPRMQKNIIIGPGFKNTHEITGSGDANTVMRENLSATQIFQLMISTDLAISAGGQTAYEFARCGVPMILLETAENQHRNILGFTERGMALSAQLQNGAVDIGTLRRQLQKIMHINVRADLRTACMKYVDGSGGKKIAGWLDLANYQSVQNINGDPGNVRSKI